MAWDQFQYLILLAGCLLVTAPLEFLLRARVYRRPVRLVLAMLPVLVVFVGWDLYGIATGHWTYNRQFVTGISLGILPLEELAFFVVITICGLLTYEAVGTVLGRLRRVARRDHDRRDGQDGPVR